MTYIKTWKEYLNEIPDIQIVTNDDVRTAMLNEIDDLRAALVKSSEDVVNISRERNALKVSANVWFDVAEKLWKEKCDLIKECALLKEKITEMNLQYISDFGQLQEEPRGLFIDMISQHEGLDNEMKAIDEEVDSIIAKNVAKGE